MKATLLVLALAALLLSAPSEAQKARALPDIVDAASKSIVGIEVRRLDGTGSTGTGFLVDSSGTVITSFHVVEGASQVQIRLSTDETYAVTSVRAVDSRRDIAILQVPAFGLTVAALGNSSEVRPGERVVVIGNALGLLNNSVTTGVVSGIRDMEGTRVFQIDAAVSPGNSGGPVLNEAGQVIGIVQFKLKAGESLNFAVPVNYARGLMQLEPTKGLALLAETSSGADDGKPTETPVSRQTRPGWPLRWRSVVNGSSRTARVGEDFVYVETDVSRALRNVGAMSMAELHKEGEIWKGTHRIRVSCKTFIFPRKLCPVVELPMTITLLTETRIEGTGEYPPDGIEFNCARCAFERPVDAKPFVWIPAD